MYWSFNFSFRLFLTDDLHVNIPTNLCWLWLASLSALDWCVVLSNKLCKVNDNYIMESRHQKIGMVFTKSWNQRRKSIPSPKTFRIPKHFARKFFWQWKSKKMFFKFQCQTLKGLSPKKGNLHTSMYAQWSQQSNV